MFMDETSDSATLGLKPFEFQDYNSSAGGLYLFAGRLSISSHVDSIEGYLCFQSRVPSGRKPQHGLLW